jgi:hypothetical protein
MTFGHYGCCATSVCACEHPMEPRSGSSDIRSHLVAMLLLLRKKCGKKSGMRRTYFRSGPLLDMATSGQCLFRSCDFVTSGQKATLRGIWHNFLLCMRRTHFRTMTDVTSGHVTGITSGHVTSDHLTSGHAQWSDPPHDPPQIWFCPYPYTTHLPLQSVVCFVLQFLVLSQDY